MKAWFGDIEFVDGRTIVRPSGKTPEEISEYLPATDSTGLNKDVRLDEIAIGSDICDDFDSYRKLLHETSLALARDRITASHSSKDAYLIQAVKALDDVNESYNIITERLTEWYAVHYPELSVRPQELIRFILDFGSREASGSPEASSSMGAPLSEADEAAVKSLAMSARVLFDERKALEKYITSNMEEIAPNLSGLMGPLLGARLISRAGSLERLAKLPASTIQVMGAGEALFKHIKSGTPSPKHGIIFKHPLISGSPKRVRGKVSRMIAAKAAIAARIDYYSGDVVDIGSDLKEKVSEIKKRTPSRRKK